MDLIQDARQRRAEIKRMMDDLHLDVKHLNQNSVWNMKTYHFCRALQDASFVVENTLDHFSDMHQHIDQNSTPDTSLALHKSIQDIALDIASYGELIEQWQTLYQCSR